MSEGGSTFFPLDLIGGWLSCCCALLDMRSIKILQFVASTYTVFTIYHQSHVQHSESSYCWKERAKMFQGVVASPSFHKRNKKTFWRNLDRKRLKRARNVGNMKVPFSSMVRQSPLFCYAFARSMSGFLCHVGPQKSAPLLGIIFRRR